MCVGVCVGVSMCRGVYVCVVAVPFLSPHEGCARDSVHLSGERLMGFVEKKPAGWCRSFCLCSSEGLHTLMLAHMWTLDVIERF